MLYLSNQSQKVDGVNEGQPIIKFSSDGRHPMAHLPYITLHCPPF